MVKSQARQVIVAEIASGRDSSSLPQTQQRLVEAWAEIHLDELLMDWTLLQSGKPPVKIEPLR